MDKEYAYVVAGDFVSTDDGTGIVRIAPAFGMNGGAAYDLPIMRTVDAAGVSSEVRPGFVGTQTRHPENRTRPALQVRHVKAYLSLLLAL